MKKSATMSVPQYPILKSRKVSRSFIRLPSSLFFSSFQKLTHTDKSRGEGIQPMRAMRKAMPTGVHSKCCATGG